MSAGDAEAALDRQVNNGGAVDMSWEQPAALSDGNAVIGGKRLDDVLRSLEMPPVQPGDDVFLARITTPEAGTNLETDPSKPTRIDPEFDHDLMWVVRRLHLTFAGNLGAADDPPSWAASPVTGDLALFVRPDGHWFASQLPGAPAANPNGGAQ